MVVVRLAVLLSLVVAISLFGCIVTEEEVPSPTPAPTIVVSPTPTTVPSPTPTKQPSPTPVVSPTPTQVPSPTPDVTPSCVISANPDTEVGPFTARVTVKFNNIQASVASIKCSGGETGQDANIGSSGVAGRDCSYLAVSTNEAYVVIATAGGVSCNVTVAVMATPFPVITNVLNASIGSNYAQITWTTDQLSNSQIDYGTTDSFGSMTTLDTSLNLTHSVNVTGLAQNTPHYYRVDSCNSVGACAHAPSSGAYSVKTLVSTTPTPTVALSTPANNAWQKVLAQTFSFTPTAGTGGTLSNCTLRTNATGSLADTQANTSVLTSGAANTIAYTLTADHDYAWNVRCYNIGSAYGEAGTSYVVKLDSTVPGAPSAPADGGKTNETITVTWTAATDGGTNPSGIASYSLYKDSALVQSGITVLTYTVTGLTPATTYNFEVEAVDTAGNTGPKAGPTGIATNA
ncbi:MAG: hypothetical protein V1881_03285 [Candidatus Micrarchaeota archaeon]